MPKSGDDLLTDGFGTQIDVVQVDCRRIRRLRCPDTADGTGQQTQHAANALEVLEGRSLAGERFQHFRVQRIARLECFRRVRVGRIGRQGFLVGLPLRPVRVDDHTCLRVVD